MDSIFVVTQCTRDYDDSWATPIFATPDRAKADNKITEMKARQINRKVVYDRLNQHMKEWEESNPRPREVLEKPKKKGQMGLSKSFSDWAKERYAEHSSFVATISQVDHDDLLDLDDRLFWEIEVIPYEE